MAVAHGSYSRNISLTQHYDHQNLLDLAEGGRILFEKLLILPTLLILPMMNQSGQSWLKHAYLAGNPTH